MELFFPPEVPEVGYGLQSMYSTLRDTLPPASILESQVSSPHYRKDLLNAKSSVVISECEQAPNRSGARFYLLPRRCSIINQMSIIYEGCRTVPYLVEKPRGGKAILDKVQEALH